MAHAPAALEIRGLRKRFTVGYGACLASAEVLRGVDLSVSAGDVLSIVGGAACGKSTLMLCAAGLLRADAGEVKWFGVTSPIAAARHVVHHLTRADLMRAGAMGEAKVHLVDVDFSRDESVLRDWVVARRDAGDAVIVACRDEQFAHSFSARVMTLRQGTLRATGRAWPRVAERRRASEL